MRSSFWFLPSLLVAGAIGLALLMIELDAVIGDAWADRWPRLFGSGAEGARGLLSTVASSMITVAGVVFSITLVSLSLAASQYTSRVLRNFMSDRVNQVVLGVFVGIFAYCLVVLRTIRAEDEGGFVPPLAVFGGLVLAFLGIAVLIHFIHHISVSIQASHILATAAAETLRTIDRQYPETPGDDPDGEEAGNSGSPAHGQPVPAAASGYLQSMDREGLVACAAERDLVIRMTRRIGDFVVEGEPVAVVTGRHASDDDRRRISRHFVIDRQRTIEDDAGFGIRQIVDVALKALSPGVNDTTTAAMCVNQLTAILARLAGRRLPLRHCGRDGSSRLLTCGPGFADLAGEAFDEIRRSAEGNVTILRGLLDSLELLAGRLPGGPRRAILQRHAGAVRELALDSVKSAFDREALDVQSRKLVERLSGGTASP